MGLLLTFFVLNLFSVQYFWYGVLVSFAKITRNLKYGLLSYLYVFIKCQKCDKLFEPFELISIHFPEMFYEEMKCNNGILQLFRIDLSFM